MDPGTVKREEPSQQQILRTEEKPGAVQAEIRTGNNFREMNTKNNTAAVRCCVKVFDPLRMGSKIVKKSL